MNFISKFKSILESLTREPIIFIGGLNDFDEVIGMAIQQHKILNYSHGDISDGRVKLSFRYVERNFTIYWWDYKEVSEVQKEIAADYLEKLGYRVEKQLDMRRYTQKNEYGREQANKLYYRITHNEDWI